MMWHVLDIFFVVFHSALILFNMFGWLWKPTRKANLITLTFTGLSWFVLGIFYGIGYCPLTDWHWNVLRHLGEENLPVSYINYLIVRLFNLHFDAQLIELATAAGFFLALICSLIINFQQHWRSLIKKLFFSALFLFLISCEQNVVVEADLDDMPVVYCVLDVNDSIHYLRLTKSFAGNQDAYDLLYDPGNMQYENVDAYMQEFVDDAFVQTFHFEPSALAEKDSGLFPFVPNSIFQLEAQLNAKARYDLYVHLEEDSIQLSSSTHLVQHFRMDEIKEVFVSETQPYLLKWTSPVNGKYYELKILYYLLRNYDVALSHETVDMIFGASTSFNNEGGERMNFKFPFSSYLYINDEYLSDTIVQTTLERIDLIFTATTEELLVYRNSASATNSEMVERKPFTNINNGKGIFSSRLVKKFEDVKIYILSDE